MFAYSSKREQSNKRSGTKLKMESDTGELFFTDFEKSPTVLQSKTMSPLLFPLALDPLCSSFSR